MKFDKSKYNYKDFQKALDLSNKKGIKYNDALAEVYEQNPKISPELKDKKSIEFYYATNAFKQWRSDTYKTRRNKK